MDYAAGFVAMQVHESNLQRAEQRIAQAHAAAERTVVQAASVPGRPRTARAPRRRFHRHAPRFAQ
ncbi:hypothetical protein GCM10009819_13940 [Agromyces tropicus]|uniref:Uncharacterized protein n=1 Tax=Agromyces tropicus TaxID=555371 RepID=A0ABN2U8I0_9MICO